MLLNNCKLSYKKNVIAENYMEDFKSNYTHWRRFCMKTAVDHLHFPKSFDLSLCLRWQPLHPASEYD